MLRHIFVLIAVFCVQARAQAWTYNTRILHEGSSCEVTLTEVGVCSFLQNCEPFLTKQIPYKDLKRCAFVGLNELVCCPHVVVSTTMPPIVTRTDTSFEDDSDEAPSRRPAKIACDAFAELNPDRITSRVFGQKLAFAGEFPHIGAMVYSAIPRPSVQCEASLIADRFALTAASCVDSKLPALVRFGMIEWNPNQKERHTVDARIKTVTKHTGYRTGSPLHDIALIEFTEDIPFSPFVSPACLRTNKTDLESSVNLQVAGWSKFNTKSEKKVMNTYLLSANVTTLELNYCLRSYRNYLKLQGFLEEEENEGLYCAVDFSKNFSTDTCYGDSGGPLMVDTEELWEIIGIVSFKNRCGIRLPNVFTRVSYYLDWIESIVWSSKSQSRNVSYMGL